MPCAADAHPDRDEEAATREDDTLNHVPCVVAFDSFKGSLRAAAASEAFARGWRSVRPGADVVLRPMADGGEGTLEAFAAATPDAVRMRATVRGPHGRDVAAHWLLLPGADDAGDTGVVELASTSGIELLGDDRLPWDADTFGFGQAIAAALDHGVERLLLGIGSSASTDAGAGMLAALGARILDGTGAPVRPGARGLADAASVDLSGLRRPPAGGAVVLSDVTSPLLGADGAAFVFGPQKGISSGELADVDAALARFAALIPGDPSAPGAGAAGGAGFALAAWGAQLRPGAQAVAQAIGLEAAIARADLVVTGEGAYDGSSAAGKAPAFVGSQAADAGAPVALVAGRIDPGADLTGFAAALSLTDLAGSAAAALADPERWLAEAGALLARTLTDVR